MNFLSPLTEFEKRNGRRRNDVVADGEHVRFDIMLLDGKSKPATDQITDQRIKAQVDREHAQHDHKFAFMGDAAPKFDRARAEFLARQQVHDVDRCRLLAESRFQEQEASSSAQAHDKMVTDLRDEHRVTNTLRLARYQG